MHLADVHKAAVAYANDMTRLKHGADSVPCEPGTDAHTSWLAYYDSHAADHYINDMASRIEQDMIDSGMVV